MKSISEFAKTPELLEITLDSEDIVKEYGEPVIFYMKDFVDINTYFDFFRSQTDGNNAGLNDVLKKIILNKEGKPALQDGQALPVDLAVAALGKINQNLGKSNPKSLTKKTGTQPA
jgi:hypothetical protein